MLPLWEMWQLQQQKLMQGSWASQIWLFHLHPDLRYLYLSLCLHIYVCISIYHLHLCLYLYVSIYAYLDIYHGELAYVITEADKSRNVLSASWRPRKPGGTAPVSVWKPKKQGSQCYKSQSKGKRSLMPQFQQAERKWILSCSDFFSIQVLSGLMLPPTWGKEDLYFRAPTNSNANLIWKHPYFLHPEIIFNLGILRPRQFDM